jgi:hypothetical protein
VYVEGEIETRVYNDSINGEVKSIPEICVRRDGMVICIHFFFLFIMLSVKGQQTLSSAVWILNVL